MNGKHKRLVIVESPAKARTIAGYLGTDFVVESTVGHIRDLPERAADIPEEYKKEPWARLGVDVEHDFEPLYVVDPDKKKKVSELKKLLAGRRRAPARDGRGPRGRGDRLAPARGAEAEGPRAADGLPRDHARRDRAGARARRATIDERLVDAQETRRILDRLYGYEVSPVLWKKIMRGLSAGRVQSVATRLVVERERERMAFRRRRSWWDLEATFDPESFEARLVALDGKRVATGPRLRPRRQAAARRRARRSTRRRRAVSPTRLDGVVVPRRAASSRSRTSAGRAAPFMTSTLQQEASRKLRFTAQTTMRVAQRLYENGYITYMRTDSTTLSESALTAARAQARDAVRRRVRPRRSRAATSGRSRTRRRRTRRSGPPGDSFRTPQQVAARAVARRAPRSTS